MAAYARQAKDTELIEMAADIKVRAERRGGEMLRDMAWVYDRITTDRGLYSVQDEARAAKRGLSADVNSVPPRAWGEAKSH